MAETRRQMGIGVIGQPNITFKRKFRWTFAIEGFCGDKSRKVPEYFVKTAGRPNIAIEELELNFLNAKTWIPGKTSWETITVTYIDVANLAQQQLWNWLATLYDFVNPTTLWQGEKPDWDAEGTLTMYDGCGTPLERWTLQHLWPTAINFGDLDYSNNEEATIELTLRYSDVIYKSLCPEFSPLGCHTGCTATSSAGAGLPGAFPFPPMM